MDLPRDIGGRVGLLGGTFDPIHNGHLAIADLARKRCSLDAVVFIPAASPPHKGGQSISLMQHRQRMLELVCDVASGYYVSTLEAQRPGPSYTVDTLRSLKNHFSPQTELFFIIGTDSFIDLPSWKEPRHLLDYASLVVVNRSLQHTAAIHQILGLHFPTYRQDREEKVFRSKRGGGAIIMLDMEPVEVSATGIRQRVRQRLSITGLVPPAVEAYIAEQGLYTGKKV